MPLFNYTCGKCETTAEYLVERADEVPEGCVNCGSSNLEKQLMGQTFSFNGSNTNDHIPKNIPAEGIDVMVISYGKLVPKKKMN